MEQAHVEALTNKHHKLAAQIETEEHRPQPDTALIQRLKREKLRLKDEIQGH
ncbi:YdcH family protein [Sphingomicrobium aestuariivivum]|uniref:YdcH family protein n=1 Tax=Sphingomicrobium aestuariivivum TaxID=1582356 RepID=UPI001FD69B6E|nr:YdcH family protein [Sphingomicrobium aestuariivivum]MCJ8192023.1 YdcH family protein [Sphingomicrobium aestuariivivum]